MAKVTIGKILVAIQTTFLVKKISRIDRVCTNFLKLCAVNCRFFFWTHCMVHVK